MLFIFSTQLLIRNLWQLKTLVFFKLSGKNLGQIFNFRLGYGFAPHTNFRTEKQPKLKVEKSGKTTFRFHPVSFLAPRVPHFISVFSS